MPILGTGPILGPMLAAAAPSTDPPGIASWLGVANALTSWLVSNTVVLPGLMVAAGSSVTGLGALSFPSSTSLGPVLAAGAGSSDEAGIAKWTEVGNAVCSHLATYGQVVPGGFVAIPVTGGPVTGVGTLVVVNPALGPALAQAAGSTDAPGIAGWAAIGLAISTHMTLAQVLANLPAPGFSSPPGGGPLTGTGSIV